MLVISDTSPLCYLILIDHIHLLPQLYDQILISEVVRDELMHSDSPIGVQSWIRQPPEWLLVCMVTRQPDSELLMLDAGERSTILLAEELGAPLILVDERKGRRVAKARGLAVTGLIGVLDRAAATGLINLPEVVKRLQATDFRASPQLLEALLQQHDHR